MSLTIPHPDYSAVWVAWRWYPCADAMTCDHPLLTRFWLCSDGCGASSASASGHAHDNFRALVLYPGRMFRSMLPWSLPASAPSLLHYPSWSIPTFIQFAHPRQATRGVHATLSILRLPTSRIVKGISHRKSFPISLAVDNTCFIQSSRCQL